MDVRAYKVLHDFSNFEIRLDTATLLACSTWFLEKDLHIYHNNCQESSFAKIE